MTYNATYDWSLFGTFSYNLFDFTLLSSSLVLWEGHDISTEGGNVLGSPFPAAAPLCWVVFVGQ